MRSRRPLRLDWRRMVLAVVVAALGVWIGAQALVAGTSDAAALGERSREALGTGDPGAATTLARQALRRDPTVVAAVQTLGLAAQAKGDGAYADRLLAYADRLSRRDLQTHLWAIERAVARGDTASALREYDLALRTSASSRDLLYPVLAGAIADPAVAHALLGRWRTAPPWRGDFLSYLATDPKVDPALAARFLQSAHGANGRATPTDVATLIARAVDAEDFATAWRAYRLVRPAADARQVRDPTFAALSETPTAFDWAPSNAGGIVAQSIRGGVAIDAEPGTAGAAIEQLQLLPAGRYRLTVDAGPQSRSGALVWTLACRNGPSLVRLAIPAGPAQRITSPAFAVADTCAVQRLTLAVDASDDPGALHAEIGRVTLTPISR